MILEKGRRGRGFDEWRFGYHEMIVSLGRLGEGTGTVGGDLGVEGTVKLGGMGGNWNGECYGNSDGDL